MGSGLSFGSYGFRGIYIRDIKYEFIVNFTGVKKKLQL